MGEDWSVKAWDYLTDTDAWFLPSQPTQLIVPPSLREAAEELLSNSRWVTGHAGPAPEMSYEEKLVNEVISEMKEEGVYED